MALAALFKTRERRGSILTVDVGNPDYRIY